MRRNWFAWMMVTPALLVIFIFFLLPVILAFGLSLTDFDLYALSDMSNMRFVWLRNYFDLLVSSDFWAAFKNTLYFVVAGVPLSLGLSLCAALLLNSSALWAKSFFRTAIFAPVVATLVAVAVIWVYLLHPRYGWINYLFGLVGISPIDWLGDPKWSMPAIIIFAAWKNFGYNAIILLAGLQGIPADLYEAADIDGVSKWKKFLKITLPMLGPSVFMVSILSVAGYFQMFGEPYVMTQGGPMRSTVSVLYLMYEQGFKWWNMGYASAVAFLLFAIIILITMALRSAQKWGQK